MVRSMFGLSWQEKATSRTWKGFTSLEACSVWGLGMTGAFSGIICRAVSLLATVTSWGQPNHELENEQQPCTSPPVFPCVSTDCSCSHLASCPRSWSILRNDRILVGGVSWWPEVWPSVSRPCPVLVRPSLVYANVSNDVSSIVGSHSTEAPSTN